jgi:hypothetical protein
MIMETISGHDAIVTTPPDYEDADEVISRELKYADPCPGCSGKLLDIDDTAEDYRVECVNCGWAGPCRSNCADAVDIWNERTK